VRIVVAVCARKNCFNVNQRTKITCHATLIQFAACHCTSNTLQHTLHRPARLGLPRFASICLDLPRFASICLDLPRFAPPLFTRKTLHYTLLQAITCCSSVIHIGTTSCARFASIRLDSPRFASIRLDSPRFASIRLSSIHSHNTLLHSIATYYMLLEHHRHESAHLASSRLI
jgi:hypothetical protein